MTWTNYMLKRFKIVTTVEWVEVFITKSDKCRELECRAKPQAEASTRRSAGNASECGPQLRLWQHWRRLPNRPPSSHSEPTSSVPQEAAQAYCCNEVPLRVMRLRAPSIVLWYPARTTYPQRYISTRLMSSHRDWSRCSGECGSRKSFRQSGKQRSCGHFKKKGNKRNCSTNWGMRLS